MTVNMVCRFQARDPEGECEDSFKVHCGGRIVHCGGSARPLRWPRQTTAVAASEVHCGGHKSPLRWQPKTTAVAVWKLHIVAERPSNSVSLCLLSDSFQDESSNMLYRLGGMSIPAGSLFSFLPVKGFDRSPGLLVLEPASVITVICYPNPKEEEGKNNDPIATTQRVSYHEFD